VKFFEEMADNQSIFHDTLSERSTRKKKKKREKPHSRPRLDSLARGMQRIFEMENDVSRGSRGPREWMIG